MKLKLILFLLIAGLTSCSNETKTSSTNESPAEKPVEKEVKKEEPKDSKGSKGIGEIKRVTLNDPLDQAMVDNGSSIYDLKCSACHKLSDKRVVGPGWKGITDKRRPEWIMNMITNVEVMLDKDPEAQKLFEECLTRMPNQNVSVEEARSILEFMYANDQAE
jgi:hypothetical protein